jgi:hypothetical protein
MDTPQPPTAARAAARLVAAAVRVRSVRVSPTLPVPAPSSVQRAPRRGGDDIVARIALAAARSARGRRWHHEQKWVARPPTTIRRIGRPHRRHGSSVRW